MVDKKEIKNTKLNSLKKYTLHDLSKWMLDGLTNTYSDIKIISECILIDTESKEDLAARISKYIQQNTVEAFQRGYEVGRNSKLLDEKDVEKK